MCSSLCQVLGGCQKAEGGSLQHVLNEVTNTEAHLTPVDVGVNEGWSFLCLVFSMEIEIDKRLKLIKDLCRSVIETSVHRFESSSHLNAHHILQFQ